MAYVSASEPGAVEAIPDRASVDLSSINVYHGSLGGGVCDANDRVQTARLMLSAFGLLPIPPQRCSGVGGKQYRTEGRYQCTSEDLWRVICILVSFITAS